MSFSLTRRFKRTKYQAEKGARNNIYDNIAKAWPEIISRILSETVNKILSPATQFLITALTMLTILSFNDPADSDPYLADDIDST